MSSTSRDRAGMTSRPDGRTSVAMPVDLSRPATGQVRPRRRALASVALVASLVLSILSLASVSSVVTSAIAPKVAGAATTSTAASWSTGPTCGSWATANVPAGTLSVSVTMSGGGGGGGGKNGGTNGGSGGAGASVTTTFPITYSSLTIKSLAVDLGCGGSAGCGEVVVRNLDHVVGIRIVVYAVRLVTDDEVVVVPCPLNRDRNFGALNRHVIADRQETRVVP